MGVMFPRSRRGQRAAAILRKPRSTPMISAAIPAAVVLALAVAGCAELERPPSYSGSSDSSLVLGEGQGVIENPEVEASASVTIDDFVPSVDGYLPEVLIAAGPQALRTTELGLVAQEMTGPIQELSVAAMADDYVGGLVVGELSGPVVYVHGQGELETIDDAGARMLDVGYWGGSPRAFLLVGTNMIDWVQLVSEQEAASRTRQPHLQLAENENVVDFSASRDLQAISIGNEDCGGLRFYGRNGTELDLPSPDDPECTFPGRPTYGTVALSRDGGAVAYTIVSYRADGSEEATELVVRELGSATPSIPRRKIGEDLDRITSLSFENDRVVYVKETGDTSSVIMLDLDEGTEQQINTGTDTVRSVSFARNPITTVQ